MGCGHILWSHELLGASLELHPAQPKSFPDIAFFLEKVRVPCDMPSGSLSELQFPPVRRLWHLCGCHAEAHLRDSLGQEYDRW